MTIHIIGCGESGALWDGEGVSIGVNDCWKFGKPTQSLLLLNRATTFSTERLTTIVNSKPVILYSILEEWRAHFPTQFKRIETRLWNDGVMKPGTIYHSKTSPFCAISLAFSLGYTKMVLWGVDFYTHQMWSPGKPGFERERLRYKGLVRVLAEKHDVKVYSGVANQLGLPIYRKVE